ncbi:transposase [Pseudomonas sp. NPDC089530]|uniref:transposase n=1 Tax=Pseudomonas sp. NPDC089530 TaxID=3390651 RepID=UPI003CFE1B0E
MTDKRRTFDDSFKLEVMRRIKDKGLGVSKVCRDLDMGDTAVRCWGQQYEAEPLGLVGDG